MVKMKYPIGIQNFESLRQDGYVYVDKTDLIWKMVDEGRYYFLSRPRRFGKSLLLSTLEAYLSGKKELFRGLAIERLEKDWTPYLIFHLDLNIGEYTSRASLYDKLNAFLTPLEEAYGHGPGLKEAGQRFEYVIKAAAEKTGKRIVILIDEYDKPMLATLMHPDLQETFRIMLKAFYGVMKSCDRYIKFALITGVTKFGKISVFSDLNNLTDLSMDRRYQTICGITDEELHKYFEESVKELAANYALTEAATYQRLAKDFDGYRFWQHGIGIYNPFSLFNTLSKGAFGSYWFETGTPSYLVEVMKQDNYCLPNLTEEQVSGDFLNSIDSMSKNPIPLIYQSGYLTIKDYDEEFGDYKLGFPNKEVEEGFIKYLMPFYSNIQEEESTAFIGSFIKDLRQGKAELFMKRMETMFSDTSYKIVGDSELYFQNCFYIICKMLGFYTHVERETSDGRMDMTIETRDYVYIIEFKLDKTAQEALQQIDDKDYAKPFALDRRKVFKIGVNFSLKKRCIDGVLIKN